MKRVSIMLPVTVCCCTLLGTSLLFADQEELRDSPIVLRFDGRSGSRAWRHPLSGCGVFRTLQTRLERSDVVLIVERDGDADARPDGLPGNVVRMLKQPDAVRFGNDDAVLLDKAFVDRPESFFLVFALMEGQSLGVIAIEPLTENARDYVVSMTRDDLDFRQRLERLIAAARSDEKWLRYESLEELAAIPFETFRRNADAIPVKTVREWAFSAEDHPSRSQAMPLLALSGDDADRERIGRLIFDRPGTDPVLTQPMLFAWLWLADQGGVEQFVSKFLLKTVVLPEKVAESQLTYPQLYSAFDVLHRVHLHRPSENLDAAWTRAARHLLKQPLFADIVFSRSREKQDWRFLPEAAVMMKTSDTDYSRIAALVYAMHVQKLSQHEPQRDAATAMLESARAEHSAAFQKAQQQWNWTQPVKEPNGKAQAADRTTQVFALLTQARMVLATPVVKGVDFTEFLAQRQDAIQYCTQALNLDPHNREALLLRATAYEQAGQKELAQKDRAVARRAGEPDRGGASSSDLQRARRDLIARLTSDKTVVRWMAVAEVVQDGPRDKELVPALIRLLDDPYSTTRRLAIQALGRIGPDAVDAVDPLLGIVKSSRPANRRRLAVESLGLIRSRKATPQVRSCLKDSSLAVRLSAAEALWRIEHSREAADALIELVGKGAPCRMSDADEVLLRIAAVHPLPAVALKEFITIQSPSVTAAHHHLLKAMMKTSVRSKSENTQ